MKSCYHGVIFCNATIQRLITNKNAGNLVQPIFKIERVTGHFQDVPHRNLVQPIFEIERVTRHFQYVPHCWIRFFLTKMKMLSEYIRAPVIIVI